MMEGHGQDLTNIDILEYSLIFIIKYHLFCNNEKLQKSGQNIVGRGLEDVWPKWEERKETPNADERNHWPNFQYLRT